jgi:putative cell wall-binding protein
MSRCTRLIVALSLALSAMPAFAQNSGNSVVLPGGTVIDGTPAEQAACAADAHHFCKDDIPDNFRVLQCLKAERDKIGKPCRTVLENHGQ